VADAITFTGYVPFDDLPALYSLAEIFVFPSVYEGFGLPVIEAMACGAPMIASRATAVGETAGDAALLVDPEDTADIAGALDRVLTDRALAAELIRRGKTRAASFTRESMTRGLVASWRRALGWSDHQPDSEAHQTPE
jgi:glycosyltransferase involved in cell wall biosynthesis